MEIKKPLIALALIFVLAAGGIVYYFYQENIEENKKEIGGSGVIEAEEIRVGTMFGGRIKEIKVREGEKVKKGSLLAILDNEVLRQQVKAAEAGVQIARAQLKEVRDEGNESEIEVAKAQLKQAEANLEAYQVQLRETRITSPLEGVILSLPVSLGEVVNSGSTIAVIGDLRKLKLVIYLPEEEAGKVKVGDECSISVDSYPGRAFFGKVSEIADQAEFTPQNIQTREQRTSLVYAVTISIENSDLALKPGQPADAFIKAE